MPQKNNFKIFYALSIAWQLGFLIAVPIGSFLFIGFLGDNFFKTSPLFLIFGIIIGVGITVYEIYHLFCPLFINVNINAESEKHNKKHNNKKNKK